jgi:hypothetical protein
MDPKPEITLRELYPHFTEDQLAEAESNIRRYLAVVVRIAERLKAEGRHLPASVEDDLTKRETQGSIPHERSKNTQ